MTRIPFAEKNDFLNNEESITTVGKKMIYTTGAFRNNGGLVHASARCTRGRYHGFEMAFPIKTCVVCSEEFELRPDKPGFANRCPACSEPEEEESAKTSADVLDRQSASEMNAARRKAIRDMLYRKES